jgi:tetratricopeptide (TPR) repeat protein
MLEDLDSLRVAVTWALDRDDRADVRIGFRIVAALFNEAAMRRASGISAWAARALERAELMSPTDRYAARCAKGWDLFQRGDVEGALDLSLLTLDEMATPEQQSAHLLAATSYAQLGDLDGANRIYEDGLALTQGAEHDLWRSALHAGRAMNLGAVGRYEEARADAEEAVAIARRLRNPTTLSLALFGLGWSSLGPDPDQARVALEESITLAESGAIQGGLDAMLGLVTPLRFRDGDVAGALDALITTLTRMRESGERLSVTNLLDSSLTVLAELGEGEVPAIITGIRGSETFGPASSGIAGAARARHDKTVAEVQAVLGEEAFDAAAAGGAAMSADEALGFLLAELQRVRAALPTATSGGPSEV